MESTILATLAQTQIFPTWCPPEVSGYNSQVLTGADGSCSLVGKAAQTTMPSSVEMDQGCESAPCAYYTWKTIPLAFCNSGKATTHKKQFSLIQDIKELLSSLRRRVVSDTLMFRWNVSNYFPPPSSLPSLCVWMWVCIIHTNTHTYMHTDIFLKGLNYANYPTLKLRSLAAVTPALLFAYETSSSPSSQTFALPTPCCMELIKKSNGKRKSFSK